MSVYVGACLAFGIKLPIGNNFPIDRFDAVDCVEVCRYCNNGCLLVVPGTKLDLSNYNIREGGLPNVIDLNDAILALTNEKLDSFKEYCRGAGLPGKPKWFFFLQYS
jgi:hypothetical protein